MQRALVFLGLVLAVVVGWLGQQREIRSLRAKLSGAESGLLGGPGAIKYAGGSETILGAWRNRLRDRQLPTGLPSRLRQLRLRLARQRGVLLRLVRQ